jgi:hypothetical protein
MFRRRLACALAGVVVGSLFVASQESEASAVTGCPSNAVHSWDGRRYDPSARVTGVRAALKFRKDGFVCDPGNRSEGAAASTWVALEAGSCCGIAQGGFVHEWYNPIGGTRYCRFWAIGNGAVIPYGCGNQTDDEVVYFRVQTISSSSGNQIYDCGTDGYATCTLKGQDSENWTAAHSEADGEASDACLVQVMGSTGDKARIGVNTDGAIQFSTNFSGVWSIPSNTVDGQTGAGCLGSYFDSFSTNSAALWDARNAQ